MPASPFGTHASRPHRHAAGPVPGGCGVERNANPFLGAGHISSQAHLYLSAPYPTCQALSDPPTLLSNAVDMQVPPYLEAMDLDAMWQGQEPLFRLKLTHLGDGSSILASSLPHGIADGSRHATLLADLATAYRGEQVRCFWLTVCHHGGLN